MTCLRKDPISQQVNQMRVGQALKISREEFEGYFHSDLRGYGTPRDALLSSCIGSAYGSVRVFQDPVTLDYTISRHEEDPNASHQSYLYHVDPDRQYLFTWDGRVWRRR